MATVLVSLLVIALATVYCSAADAATSTNDFGALLKQIDFKHSAHLDSDQQVLLRWSAISLTADVKTPDVFMAEISAPAKGYVGFGMSPAGGMINADILLMWVDDKGQAVLQNRFAAANGEPQIDADQSTTLAFEGVQNDTHTRFRFARLINASCISDKDYSIEPSAMRVIYAYSDEDPSPLPESRAKYHGPTKRGTRTLYLLDDPSGAYERDKQAAFRDTTKTWEFKAEKFEIPSIETHYQCAFHQFPKDITRDMHIVGFEAIIDPATVRFLHHFVVRICSDAFVPTANNTQPFSCSNETPADVAAQNAAAECMSFIMWAWGKGGTATFMPYNVGYRLTPKDSARYFIIETHYDNPTQERGMLDSSGVRMLLMDAPTLRPEDASHFFVGVAPAPTTLIVPSGQPSFTIPGVCTPECTSKYVPKNGVTVFSVFLHAHTIGKSLVLRHFRDGKELPPVASDLGYDFNYQEWRPVNVTLLPGDRLVAECNYSSVARTATTLGGLSTTDEMCYAFIFTTPPILMKACGSVLVTKNIANAIESKDDALNTEIGIDTSGNFSVLEYTKKVQAFKAQMKSNFDWNEKVASGQTKADALQDLYKNDIQKFYCLSSINATDFAAGNSTVMDVWQPFQASSKQCPNAKQ